MRTLENLDACSGGGWGVFIALNHQTTVGEGLLSMGTPATIRCASHVSRPLGSDRWSSDWWGLWAVRWCTGQCPVRQAGSNELAALGNSPATYDYNSPDCPVCTGLSGAPSNRRPPPTVMLVVGAINTPTTPPFMASKFSHFSTTYKS